VIAYPAVATAKPRPGDPAQSAGIHKLLDVEYRRAASERQTDGKDNSGLFYFSRYCFGFRRGNRQKLLRENILPRRRGLGQKSRVHCRGRVAYNCIEVFSGYKLVEIGFKVRFPFRRRYPAFLRILIPERRNTDLSALQQFLYIPSRMYMPCTYHSNIQHKCLLTPVWRISSCQRRPR